MKKVLVVLSMMIILVSVKAYAWKGVFGCCCCCDEAGVGEYERLKDQDRSRAVSRHVVSNFEEFEKCFAARGDREVEINFPIIMKRKVRAGQGHKAIVYNNHYFDLGRERYVMYPDTLIEYDGIYRRDYRPDWLVKSPEVRARVSK
jgi:hypothetical protein